MSTTRSTTTRLCTAVLAMPLALALVGGTAWADKPELAAAASASVVKVDAKPDAAAKSSPTTSSSAKAEPKAAAAKAEPKAEAKPEPKAEPKAEAAPQRAAAKDDAPARTSEPARTTTASAPAQRDSSADSRKHGTATSGPLTSPQPVSKADSNGTGANPGGAVGSKCTGHAYCSTRDGSPSLNGNGGGDAGGKPCAGCVGKADNKNPKGQAPNGTDRNNGYECDGNNGIGKTNPAHTGCKPAPAPTTPPKLCPNGSPMPASGSCPGKPVDDNSCPKDKGMGKGNGNGNAHGKDCDPGKPGDKPCPNGKNMGNGNGNGNANGHGKDCDKPTDKPCPNGSNMGNGNGNGNGNANGHGKNCDKPTDKPCPTGKDMDKGNGNGNGKGNGKGNGNGKGCTPQLPEEQAVCADGITLVKNGCPTPVGPGTPNGTPPFIGPVASNPVNPNVQGPTLGSGTVTVPGGRIPSTGGPFPGAPLGTPVAANGPLAGGAGGAANGAASPSALPFTGTDAALLLALAGLLLVAGTAMTALARQTRTA